MLSVFGLNPIFSECMNQFCRENITISMIVLQMNIKKFNDIDILLV